MSWRKAVLFGFALSFCFLSSKASCAADTPDALVVPSRYTIVKLAFDMDRIRDVRLLSYHAKDTTEQTRLYTWNAGLEEWEPVSLAEYREAKIFRKEPGTVLLVGTEKQMPAELLEASSWAEALVRLESLDIVELVNGLDKVFDFSPREWRWLAERYGLKLKDRNEKLRRWGKYGPPGSENNTPKTPGKKDVSEEPEQKTTGKEKASDIVKQRVRASAQTNSMRPVLKVVEPVEDTAPEDK
jgi:hypothetical protein